MPELGQMGNLDGTKLGGLPSTWPQYAPCVVFLRISIFLAGWAGWAVGGGWLGDWVGGGPDPTRTLEDTKVGGSSCT